MNRELTFGQFVAEKRKDRGYTQQELADMLNVTVTAVSKWENDKVYPDITRIPKLANLLSVSEHELLNASIDRIERRNIHFARNWMRLVSGFSILNNWVLPITYISALIACFVVDLSVNGRMTWFWTVLASVFMSMTLTTIPNLIKKRKLFWVSFSELVSLLSLLAVCNGYVHGSWFLNSAVPILFVYVSTFTPLFIHYHGTAKVRSFNVPISIAVGLSALAGMLFYFGVL